jgi:hypothetical protein
MTPAQFRINHWVQKSGAAPFEFQQHFPSQDPEVG